MLASGPTVEVDFFDGRKEEKWGQKGEEEEEEEEEEEGGDEEEEGNEEEDEEEEEGRKESNIFFCPPCSFLPPVISATSIPSLPFFPVKFRRCHC